LKLLILGQGRLAPYILESVEKIRAGIYAYSLSCKNLTHHQIISTVNEFKPDVMLDMMDPSTDSIPAFASIRRRNISLRKLLPDFVHAFGYYSYLSSANLYSPSTNLVTENSPLLVEPTSFYLRLKRESESLLTNSSFQVSILRVPSIWYLNTIVHKPLSFFDDLNISTKNGHYLSPREGDHKPFSYINATQAAHQISNVLLNQSTGLINITSCQWSTRFYLKNNLDYQEKNSKGLRITSNRAL